MLSTQLPLANKGFKYGSGLTSPDRTKFIVNIPKNASSFFEQWAKENKWTVAHADHVSQTLKEIIVILRDPVERWISGFAQYVSGNILHAKRFYNTDTGPGPDFQYMSGVEFVKNYNPLTERLVFDNLELFDDHVWSQQIFFKDLLPNLPRTYFYINKNINYQLQTYLGWLPASENLDRNDSNNDSDKKLIKQFITDRLKQISELEKSILDAYVEDYKLIEQIKHDSRQSNCKTK
jgi:hypothetical protein